MEITQVSLVIQSVALMIQLSVIVVHLFLIGWHRRRYARYHNRSSIGWQRFGIGMIILAVCAATYALWWIRVDVITLHLL